MDEQTFRSLVASCAGEGIKADFKSALPSLATPAQLAREVAAIANADGGRSDGFVFVGIERDGTLVGKIDLLDSDSGSASILHAIREYIEPEPRIEWLKYRDPSLGWFGAIWIHASAASERPHFIRKGCSVPRGPDGKSYDVLREGEILIRHGEEVGRAKRSDVERLYSQRYGLELDRLRGLMPGTPTIQGVTLEAPKAEAREPNLLYLSQEQRREPPPDDDLNQVEVWVTLGGAVALEPPWRWSISFPADVICPVERQRRGNSVFDLLPVSSRLPRTSGGPFADEDRLRGWCDEVLLPGESQSFRDVAFVIVWKDAPELATVHWSVRAKNLPLGQRGEFQVGLVARPLVGR
ncbi:MAG: ATP-binding protein [Deltaproteobacteria bacterium]|nr:ATP-binding protein [Deltaproteobacteria bacterium]